MEIGVLLADDHVIVRDGLKALLASEGDIRVVGVAGDGFEAVALAAKLRPDVVVMDIAMTGLNGIEATERIQVDSPGTQVIVLSMYASSENIYRALRAGARGYLPKESAGAEVVSAIRAVHAGRRYLSQTISEAVIISYLDGQRASAAASPLERLTRREREVLQLVVEGSSSAEIASRLSLSPKTVDTYRSRIMRKLDIHDVPGLVRFAIQHGLTPPV